MVYSGSSCPGFESRPGASPQGALRGVRSLCEHCTNKVIRDRLPVRKNKIRLEISKLIANSVTCNEISSCWQCCCFEAALQTFGLFMLQFTNSKYTQI